MKTFKKYLHSVDACQPAIEWAGDKTVEQVVAECHRGDWLLWLAKKCGVELQPLTLAKGHCANTVRHLMSDERSLIAVDVAIAFGEGKATRQELDAAATAASAASYAAYAAAADSSATAAAYSAATAAAYAAADFSVEDGAFADRFLALVQPGWGDGSGRAVLDLGCGPGNISERLARRLPAAQVLGLDGAAAMLAIADDRRRRADPPLPGLAYRQVTFPLDPATLEALRARCRWDAVVCNSVLHHLHEPAVFWQTLRELVPAGALLLLRDLRRPDDEPTRLALVQRHAADAPAVLRHDFAASLAAAFTPAEVEGQLLQAGLTGLQVRPLGDRHLEVWGILP